MATSGMQYVTIATWLANGFQPRHQEHEHGERDRGQVAPEEALDRRRDGRTSRCSAWPPTARRRRTWPAPRAASGSSRCLEQHERRQPPHRTIRRSDQPADDGRTRSRSTRRTCCEWCSHSPVPPTEEDLRELVDVGVELRACASSRACAAAAGRSRRPRRSGPGRGLITATTSARNTASAMPWVTSSVVAGRSVQIRSSSRLSRWRVMSSSAPNGSSSSSTVGSTTRAAGDRHPLAHAAGQLRGLGLLEARRGRPARSGPSIRPGRALDPGDLERQPDVAVTLRHGSSAASWNAMPRWWSRRISAGARRATSACRTSAASRPARIRRIVDLPQPDGPEQRQERALAGAEVDAVQRDDRLAPDRELLREAPDVDARWPRRARPAASSCDAAVASCGRRQVSSPAGLQVGVLVVDLVEHATGRRACPR